MKLFPGLLICVCCLSGNSGFVPEGHKRLAGGETTGTTKRALSSPERATDKMRSVALSGLEINSDDVPVVSPPANIHCASSAKTCTDTVVETRYEDSRISMACAYSIVVYGEDESKLAAAASAAFDEVDRIDRLMSHYKPESPLSKLNRKASTEAVKVEPEMFDFITECLRYSRESDGAFDVTVGPLLKAWGFFRGEGRMPKPAELVEARAKVGWRHVILNEQEKTIRFDRAGVELDLGGIAKGYAVDKAVEVLRQHGVSRALVSACGSTIYGLGAPPGETGWEVKLRDPVSSQKTAMTVRLKDRALSVSGSYEKFFDLGGKRYSHIFDPRTGWPVQGVLSVAVLTNTGTAGDALDNVFYVLGVEKSRKLLKKLPKTEAFFFLPEKKSTAQIWKLAELKN